MTNPRWGTLILFTACLPFASKANAQLEFLDKVFGKVTDVDAGFVFGRPLETGGILASSSLQGLAIEVLLDLGDVIPNENAQGCKKDTTFVLSGLEMHYATVGKDSVSKYEVKIKDKPNDCTTYHVTVAAEIGLGYSQVGGFRGDSLQLHGAVEELPALSLYFTLYKHGWWLKPYGGIRAGLTRLKDLSATSADSLFRGSGSTYEYGVLGGLSVGPPNTGWNLFVEVAWTYRNFDGITWSGNAALLPAILGQDLKLNTRTVLIGGQVEFGEGEDK